MRIDIVGGGIAGSITALGLLADGHDVHMHERAPGPRTTLCGEGVSSRALRALRPVFDATPHIDTTFLGVQWHFPGTTVKVHHPCHTMDRAGWIAAMHEAITRRGGRIDYGYAVDADDLDGDVVVGADGPGSRTARLATGTAPTRTSGMQMVVEQDEAPPHLVFHTSKAFSPEYAWSFARQGAANVGVLMAGDGQDEARLHAYADHLGLSAERERVQVYPIATGGTRWASRDGSVLLIGDAAGLTNPLTKGGIAAIVHALGLMRRALRSDPRDYRRSLARHPLTERAYRRTLRRLRTWDDPAMRRLLAPAPDTIHIGGPTPTRAAHVGTRAAMRAPWRVPAMWDLHRSAARALHWSW